MQRERSEFKPKLTVVDVVERAAGTLAGALPCRRTRVLLLLAETPPPKLERPNRLVLPVAKGEGTTGLRIAAPPSHGFVSIARSASDQNAVVSSTQPAARLRRKRDRRPSQTHRRTGRSSSPEPRKGCAFLPQVGT